MLVVLTGLGWALGLPQVLVTDPPEVEPPEAIARAGTWLFVVVPLTVVGAAAGYLVGRRWPRPQPPWIGLLAAQLGAVLVCAPLIFLLQG